MKTNLIGCCCIVSMLALMLVASGPVAAQTTAGQAKVYQPGEVHVGNSRAFVHVAKTGLGHEHGVEGRIREGFVRLNATQNAGRIVFDMSSFVADTDLARKYVGLEGTSDSSTQQQVTANMLGKDVLDVTHYPTATFEIASAQPLAEPSRSGMRQYQLNGQFTLHGVTRPLQVIAESSEQNGWTHLRGGFAILQSQFGIKPFTKAFGAIGVADRLEIWGDLWLAGVTSVSQNATSSRR